MKKIVKPLVVMIIAYVGAWIMLSKTEAGPLTLQLAAQQNNAMMGKAFLALGADPARPINEGMNSLHVAAFVGGDQVVPQFLDGGTPVNAQDDQGRTALHLAAYAGKAEVVRILIERGAELETQESTGGMTALHLAVVEKHREVVRVLIEKGANAYAADNNGVTPRQIAEYEKQSDLVTLLDGLNS